MKKLIDRLRRVHEDAIPPFVLELAELEWDRFRRHVMTGMIHNLLTSRRQAFIAGFSVGAVCGARAPGKIAAAAAAHWTRRAWAAQPDRSSN